MTGKKEDGGPAFPREYEGRAGVSIVRAYDRGMSLRDYFAAQAMLVMIDNGYFGDMAARAYKIADAMLAERAK